MNNYEKALESIREKALRPDISEREYILNARIIGSLERLRIIEDRLINSDSPTMDYESVYNLCMGMFEELTGYYSGDREVE